MPIANMTEIIAMNENGAIFKSLAAIGATIMSKGGKTYLYAFYGSYGNRRDEKREEIILLKGFKSVTWISGAQLAIVCDGFGTEKPGAAMLRAAALLYGVACTED